MLLKQFSNDLPTTKDKFILSSFHLLLPSSCINHDLTLRTGNLCVSIRWEHIFNCYLGRCKDWHGSTHPIQDSFHFPACLLLLAGLFLQVKKRRVPTATVPQHLSELLLLFQSSLSISPSTLHRGPLHGNLTWKAQITHLGDYIVPKTEQNTEGEDSVLTAWQIASNISLSLFLKKS